VLTRFFGRQQETARLVDLLSRRTVRLVTLAGPGGVGKTRLAIEVARRMAGVLAHDICLVELAGVSDGKAVDDAVAAALRLPTSGRSSSDAIVDYLRDKTVLLLLDNCEQVVKACARLIDRLCREAIGLTVLATSRIPLHLPDEHVVRLEPFATPVMSIAQSLSVADLLSFDSVQLFTNRASQALLQFTLTDQRGHALLAAADLSSAITDFSYGLQCARQAQELFQQLGNQRGEIDARLKHCELAQLAGERAHLHAQVEEALQMAEQISYMAGMAKGKYLLGSLAYFAGDSEGALPYVLSSVTLWRELQNPFELAAALNRLSGPLVSSYEFAAAGQAL
jgi:hypothetical protein